MFTNVLDTLIFFMLTVPIVGWAASKVNHVKIRDWYAVLGFLITAYFVYDLYLQVSRNGIVTIRYSNFIPVADVCFEIDMLSVFMTIVFVMLGAFVSIYSVRYMERDKGLNWYYTILIALIISMIGATFAGDLFTLFIFWQLLTITATSMVSFRRERWAPVEASLKYFIMAEVGAACILYAMSILYGMAGTLNFARLAIGIREAVPNPWIYLAIALLIVGFGVEATIVPLHFWLPDAHPEAPSSISAILSGALIKVGIYGICRVLFLIFVPTKFHWGIVIAIFAVITMTVGNIMALLQNDVKRLLAYSTVAHSGYILTGVAVGTQLGLTGSFFHVINHALMKGLAFMCAGAFVYRTETRDLNELSGIGRRMPVTITVLCVSLFALLGFPSLNGFVSKYILFTSAIDGGMPLLAIAGLLNSAFSAAYYLRMIQILVLAEPTDKMAKVKEAPLSMLAPMGMMAFLIVLFGVWPEPVIALADKAAHAALNFQEFVKAATS